MSGFPPSLTFRWWTPGNDPAQGYQVAFFGAGLDPIQANAKAVYPTVTDAEAGTNPILNPLILDAEGKTSFVLGDGLYKIEVRQPPAVDDPDPWVDWQNGLTVTGGLWDKVDAISGGGVMITVANITELRALPADAAGVVLMQGYAGPGDGGHGLFWWNSGDDTADDGGYTVNPDSDPANGRWNRIGDEDGFVRAASFGFIQATAADQTTALTNADIYAASVNRPLLIDVGTGTGTGATITAMTFTAPKVVFLGRGLKGSGSPALTFEGVVEAPNDAFLFEDMGAITFSAPNQVAYPEWWNTTKDGVTDDLAKINAMFATGAARFVFAEGDYEVTSSPSFPSTGQIVSYGTVTQGGTTHVAPGLRVLNSNGVLRSGGSVNADVNVNAVQNVNATEDLTAGQDLIAGVLGDGYMEGRIGGKKFRAGGRVLQDLTIVNVSGDNTEKNLLSAVLPANTLINNGDTLDIYTWIQELNNGSDDAIDFTYRVYIDGQVIYEALHINNAAAGAGAGIDLEGPFRLKLVKVTDDTPPNSGLECNGDLFLRGPIQVGTATVGPADLGADARGVILDLTSAQTIQFTVEIEDGDGIQQAVQERLYIDYQPAATP